MSTKRVAMPVKKQFARVLEMVLQGAAVVITKHDAPKAVLLSVDEFNALTRGAEGTLDLKAYGARIFIDAARIYALAHSVPQTNTAERLRAVHAAGAMGEAEARAAVEAFFAVQAIRLRVQAAAQGAEAALQNRIDPSRLGRLESTLLKESLRIARELQDRLSLDYRL